jgi:hypothetical protein
MERSPSLPEPSFSRGRRRPTPDYSSRRSQIKLLVLVFALLAMLRLMDEARQPGNWKWFVSMQQPSDTGEMGSQGEKSQGAPPAIDTRPPAQAAPNTPAEPVVSGSQPPVSMAELAESPQDLAAQNALLNGWTIVWDRLTNDLQNQFSRGLWTHRQGGAWDENERLSWTPLIDRVHDQWKDYLIRLRKNLERDQSILTPAQQDQCREVVAQLERTSAEQLAALRAIVEPGPLSPDQAAALDSLQKTLDARAWKAVEDNTVLRSADNEAWNRAWELVALPATTAQAESATFVQLFAQSKAYRGRAVRVQGTARLGYRVLSRTKRQGLDGYYVLWLHPADGTDSPIAVYVASLPAGFPPLAERTSLGNDTTSNGTVLHEDVTVTGLYFKRWLYGSQGGPNLAPLIIGSITDWSPPAASSDGDDSLQRSAPAAFLLTIASALIVCGLLGWALARRRQDRSVRGANRNSDGSMPNFDVTGVRGSVSESLRALHGEANDDA